MSTSCHGDLLHLFVLTLAHREKKKRKGRKTEIDPADLKCKAIDCVKNLKKDLFGTLKAFRKHLRMDDLHPKTSRAQRLQWVSETYGHLSQKQLEMALEQTGKIKKEEQFIKWEMKP